MKVGLTLPILNNFQQAIEAIQSARSVHDLEVYIVDQFRTQRPLAQAWNEGAKALFDKGCEFAIIANDDILFGPDCIDNMVEEFVQPRDKNIVLVSANNIIGNIPYPSMVLDLHDQREGSTISDHPNYSLFMIGRDFFDKVGTFDENYWPAWWEDNDSHYRIKLLGYRAICSTYCSSIHYGSVTSSKLENEQRKDSHSRAYYLKKWGSSGRAGVENYQHPYGNEQLSPKEWIPNYEV